MAADDNGFMKGFFGRVRLPVTGRYLHPRGRGRLFALGGALTLLAAVPLLLDAFVGRAAAVSNGPLSTNHAVFGKECTTCHGAFEGVSDDRCGSCHEPARSPLGVHTFARHYLYRSTDFDRSAPSTSELRCAECHGEHQGRDASLTRVDDASCGRCHDFGTFDEGHPDFRFAVEGIPDPANLYFTHVRHVAEVMDEEELADLEAACLSCHVPRAGGRSFEPISFERSCDACHMGSSTSTPNLPVVSGTGPGVRTLEAMRAEAGPGSLWADYADPNAFRRVGDAVSKRPVHHADPWVLENLRRLRRELYPGVGLADLLDASSDVPPRDVGVLYREAVATLERQIQALGGDPSRDVQRELAALTELLRTVEKRLDDPLTTFNETRFDVRVADRAPGIASGELDESAYQDVVDSLTAECRVCHVVARATIQRVQKDQRTLDRAEFDHGAHVIHASCLDCHTSIPIRETLAAEEDEAPPDVDHAGIQNLPTVETCRSCHSGAGAGNTCMSCHAFHPDEPHRASTVRYRTVEAEGGLP